MLRTPASPSRDRDCAVLGVRPDASVAQDEPRLASHRTIAPSDKTSAPESAARRGGQRRVVSPHRRPRRRAAGTERLVRRLPDAGRRPRRGVPDDRGEAPCRGGEGCGEQHAGLPPARPPPSGGARRAPVPYLLAVGGASGPAAVLPDVRRRSATCCATIATSRSQTTVHVLPIHDCAVFSEGWRWVLEGRANGSGGRLGRPDLRARNRGFGARTGLGDGRDHAGDDDRRRRRPTTRRHRHRHRGPFVGHNARSSK